ncbi:DUF2075 domain-containing protein [Staphylococcus simulans]|uniref:DUF2075 domain-containing protein n=1 Tax=Staphylococcus simulans TaxID=1286 RepID=UPI0028A3FB01|nr:DUF2075 domain-containing protein [Staphylococcus simulans]MDT4010764.1 DUF2075 domain-containing protein [Staphylococcus simulans]
MEDLNHFVDVWEGSEDSKYLLKYPTVYIINDDKQKGFKVYVGETADIKERTSQHLLTDAKTVPYWADFSLSLTSTMYVIGHRYFNKSLTLDVENRLMQYLSSVDSIEYIYNKRANQQNDYYTADQLDDIFTDIWKKLNKENNILFPVESIIRDSAIFKASPFHKLTQEQNKAKEAITGKIKVALHNNLEEQLVLVEGEAGSGKTVLMSSLFFDLKRTLLEENDNQPLSVYLLVNHDEQLKVYQEIAKKLGLYDLKNKKQAIVNKPTSFINQRSTEDKVDVIIVDEAHLLWTQGKQSYRGQNQLKDLIARAKVVIAVFDRNQILSTEQVIEADQLEKLVSETKANNNHIHLNNQMRINSNEDTVDWIRRLIDKQTIDNIPEDDKYDIKIFDQPKQLEQAIRNKAQSQDSGISRLLATYDWKYNSKAPEEADYWRVRIGEWSMPWNSQLKVNKREKSLSWPEQSQTIDEVGSTFTVQGFDLNYAGVIIGPSVKFRDGKIIFDGSESYNQKATRNRTLSDNTKAKFTEKLLKNELNVLLTRGVNGLYIYAVDEALQNELKRAANGGINHE